MTAERSSHRLDGLEPDNLLAFLALLGLLRAIEADDDSLPGELRARPRASWASDDAPLRPRVHLLNTASRDSLLERAVRGLHLTAKVHEFDGRRDLNYSRQECRSLMASAAREAALARRGFVDLIAALMTDAAIKDPKKPASSRIDGTPFCLQYGQGHQHFLERFELVPRQEIPPPRGRGKKAVSISATECLEEALFQRWNRSDPTPSFRWDPESAVRYALMAYDPTSKDFSGGTQHAANRLAAVGLAALTLAPQQRFGRVRPAVIGGAYTRGFSFAWPIWREPASLQAIRAMLMHPDLRKAGALSHLGVEVVMVANRISVLKYLNFGRARLSEEEMVAEENGISGVSASRYML